MSASIEQNLQALSLFFVVIVVSRLIYLQLFRVYPFFFTLLCITLVLQLVAVHYGDDSDQFLRTYNRVEYVRNILYVLVVWELFSVIFRNYAGLRSLSRWVMGAAAVIAMVGLGLIMAPSGVTAFNHSARARQVIRFERGITLGLVIFIIIMLYFISRYPIRLPRNNVVLCMVYSAWFLGDSAILLVMSFLPNSYAHVNGENAALAVLEISSYIGWAFLLSRTGEFQETRVRQHISPEREELLIGELNAMNNVLLRAGRSISHNR